jgi:hypothetical protein
MFISVTFFTSIDAVRRFAGEDYEQAVVKETARRALSRWDERVAHHDVAVDLLRPHDATLALLAEESVRSGLWD